MGKVSPAFTTLLCVKSGDLLFSCLARSSSSTTPLNFALAMALIGVPSGLKSLYSIDISVSDPLKIRLPHEIFK